MRNTVSYPSNVKLLVKCPCCGHNVTYDRIGKLQEPKIYQVVYGGRGNIKWLDSTPTTNSLTEYWISVLCSLLKQLGFKIPKSKISRKYKAVNIPKFSQHIVPVVRNQSEPNITFEIKPGFKQKGVDINVK